jgi:hypothetical protein
VAALAKVAIGAVNGVEIDPENLALVAYGPVSTTVVSGVPSRRRILKGKRLKAAADP